MDADTFRYLLSALIQVLGALIPLNAIFLIFKKESIEKKVETLADRIIRYYEMFLTSGNIYEHGDLFKNNVIRDRKGYFLSLDIENG